MTDVGRIMIIFIELRRVTRVRTFRSDRVFSFNVNVIDIFPWFGLKSDTLYDNIEGLQQLLVFRCPSHATFIVNFHYYNQFKIY